MALMGLQCQNQSYKICSDRWKLEQMQWFKFIITSQSLYIALKNT